MTSLFWFILFFLGVSLTIVTAQLFTEKAEDVARAIKLPPFFTGVLVTIFAMALPELLISIFASAQNYSSIVPSYATSANLINFLLIHGILMVSTKSIVIEKETLWKQVPLLLGSSFLLFFLAIDGRIESWEGVILLITFFLFVLARREEYRLGLLGRLERLFHFGSFRNVLPLFILSLLGLAVGSYLTVRGVIEISEIQNWNPAYLASSIVALAVSAPEMILAHRAVKKGNSTAAIQILIGSSILNASLVLALPSFLGSLNVLDDVIGISLMFLLLSSILFSFLTLQRNWSSHQGGLFILIYLVFLFQFLNPLF